MQYRLHTIREDAARKMGLVDTPDGIRFRPSAPGTVAGPPLSSETEEKPSDLLVEANDKQFATEYSFLLMSQMKSCTFAESDRLGKRRSHRVGFPGIACKNCFGANGAGRYFPSSVKTFADVSKTMNVLHNHLMRCKCCPEQIKGKLESLKQSHHTDKEAKKFGSQKIFFDIVWSRLHKTSGSPSSSQGGSMEELNNSSPESSSSWITETEAGSSAAKRLAYASPTSNTASATGNACRRNMDSPKHDPSINDIALIMTSLSKAPVVWDDDDSPRYKNIQQV